MLIAVIALGSRGDVQPLVALGVGLKNAGHTVRVVTSRDFEDLTSSHGLSFFDAGGNFQSVAREMDDLLERGNFLKILSRMGAAAQDLIVQASRSALAACQGVDLIVAGLGGQLVGLALSEKLGVAFVQAYYFPSTPTREFPSALAPLPPVALPGWANRLTHHIAQQMMWQTHRSAVNRALREVFQMPPARFWGPFASLERQKRTVLYGYSPEVIPRPRDWGDHVHVTGYWFLDPPAAWEPPTDLVAFLQAGPPPVYVGFGSMVNRRPGETTDLVLRALSRTRSRGVLSAGWGSLKRENLPENVFMVGSPPHSWLFTRMAAVVHHGGAGTTAAGLRAGVPSIVTPFMGDQPFWGRRVFELGVGPKPIAFRDLTVDSLVESITRAVSDSAMRERAARLGERIRDENGVARAVAIIEEQRR